MDDAAKCLFYPFETGMLDAPAPDARACFLNAVPCPPGAILPAQTTYQQAFRPAAKALERAGLGAVARLKGEAFDLALVLAPKQMAEMQYCMAQALLSLREGGLFLVAAANDAGGNRLAKLVERAGLQPASESKHKARVVWATKTQSLDDALLGDWLFAGRMQPVLDGAFVSCPGLFSWDRIDPGSALLAWHMPAQFTGAGADFGCGFGFLSREILMRATGPLSLICIDADSRALEACRENVSSVRGPAKVDFVWDDLAVPEHLPSGLDWVVMNPPFHAGREQSVRLGTACIASAAKALRRGGQLYMVSNVHLPYEAVLASAFRAVETLHEGGGYKIHRGLK